MTKELPYFKFFPSKWLTGDITLQEQNLQGIFINVCAVYWSKKCSLTIASLKHRYGEAIAPLLNSELIKLDGAKVLISFLDEQWVELNGNHEKNSENGKKGAEKRWKKNSPPIALRKEKKRKEKSISNPIFFKESDIFDKKDFAKRFPDWSKDKLKYYYESADRYSNEGNKYVNWDRAVSNWASRDEIQGKIKFTVNNNSKIPNGII